MNRMQSPHHAYWHGKTVLITGASSGLGWALVEALAPCGVKFGLLSRRTEKMQELAARLADSGSSFWIRACDVSKREQVLSAVADFAHEYGKLDVVWANSGVGKNPSFERWDWDKFEELIDTNLKGAIYTIHASLEVMKYHHSGVVVGIGSAASMRGLPQGGVYSLTKIGLEYYMESMSLELPFIQFTIIHPGFVDTSLNQDVPNRMWLLDPSQAAQLMIAAVEKKKWKLIYPMPMSVLYHAVKFIPHRLYKLLASKALQKRQAARKVEPLKVRES